MGSRALRLHDLAKDSATWHGNSAAENDRSSQQSKSSSLMCGSQPRRDHVDQRADAEGDLESDEMDHALDALVGILGKLSPHTLAEASVCEETHDGSEGSCCEHAVVKLNERRVLEHVAPPQV